MTDPNPANNRATDTDTLAASADLSITKTDGVTTGDAGRLRDLHHRRLATPARSNATGATVADTFPAVAHLHLDLRRARAAAPAPRPAPATSTTP